MRFAPQAHPQRDSPTSPLPCRSPADTRTGSRPRIRPRRGGGDGRVVGYRHATDCHWRMLSMFRFPLSALACVVGLLVTPGRSAADPILPSHSFVGAVGSQDAFGFTL